jgi:hypothetical protein
MAGEHRHGPTVGSRRVRRFFAAGAAISTLVIGALALAGCTSASQPPTRPSTSVTATTSPPTTTTRPSNGLPGVTTTTGSALPTTTTAPVTTTTTPVTTTTSPPTTTTVPATTTTLPATTTAPATTTTTTPATTSASSSQWWWLVLALVLVAGLITGIVLVVRRRNRDRAELAWRQEAQGALDGARLARGLLPVSAGEIPDAARWQSVREQVEQAALALERAGSAAPTPEGAASARRAAESLRGMVFALESDQLLRDGTKVPTADELAQADALCRARGAELDVTLGSLEGLVRPTPDARPASGAAGPRTTPTQ